jgi:hypothetical protein
VGSAVEWVYALLMYWSDLAYFGLHWWRHSKNFESSLRLREVQWL